MFSASPIGDLVAAPDLELARFARSFLEIAGREWSNEIVPEPETRVNRQRLYTETHFALTAVLLSFIDRDRSWLDVAEHRLRLWNNKSAPLTSFNSMAFCLTAILLRRAGVKHPGLQAVLADLIERTPGDHREVVYRQWCGNNAYLQQVAIDTVLLPLAREIPVTRAAHDLLVTELRRYQSSEGLFFDLPREGTAQERLAPPTYILKTLFVAGLCHELHPTEELAGVFQRGMATLLPLVTRDGHVSYFGRTDNSPFAAGLLIFNLRKAARMDAQRAPDYERAADAAERYYLTFPRTAMGLLECTRFRDPASLAERVYSRDTYAYVGQYSISSCAYALLGCHWYPKEVGRLNAAPTRDTAVTAVATSRDLGVVKVASGTSELVVRTASQVSSLDRRYLGPTILRYQVGDTLLVGAISHKVSSDRDVRPRPSTRPARALASFVDPFVHGHEQLDAAAVGFLPVIRRGAIDYLPYSLIDLETSDTHVRSQHHMLRLNVRGYHAWQQKALEIVREARERRNRRHRAGGERRFTDLSQNHFVRLKSKPVEQMTLSRTIDIGAGCCRIEDHIVGDLAGARLLFSVRALPSASVRVSGLEKLRAITGWGSDGRQTIEIYGTKLSKSEIHYTCEVQPA